MEVFEFEESGDVRLLKTWDVELVSSVPLHPWQSLLLDPLSVTLSVMLP
jgi:hypothetical protein